MGLMNAYLIDPVKREITAVTYSGLADLNRLIGGPIELAAMWSNGDTIYVDEEGLLKPQASYWGIPSKRPDQPFAGPGVMLGEELADDVDGWARTRDPAIAIETLRGLVVWVVVAGGTPRVVV